MTQFPQISVIGAAIVDVLARPFPEEIKLPGSLPLEEIELSYGGDALNEAVVLSRLGKAVQLVSVLGRDEAGESVLSYCRKNGLSTDRVLQTEAFPTGVNVVLIDEQGERRFLTNSRGSLRKLAPSHLPPIEELAPIVSFASIFISPDFPLDECKLFFQKVKSSGRLLAADMTRAKNGETLEDLKPLLPYVDILFPNLSEIEAITGRKGPRENAKALLDAGLTCAVIKLGSEGCWVQNKEIACRVPAYPVNKCVDTTGAGDSFAAGFLWALSEGLDYVECARYACCTASLSVEKIGATAGIQNLNQVESRVTRHHRLFPDL